MKSPKEIVDYVWNVAKEDANLLFVTDMVSGSIPQRYSSLKWTTARSIISALHHFIGQEFPVEDVMEILRKMSEDDEEKFSPECEKAIIESYREQVLSFDERQKHDSIENEGLRDLIHRMPKAEIRLAIARAKGLNIVDENWPCGQLAVGSDLDAVIDVLREGDYWVPAIDSDKEVYTLKYPVLRSIPSGWPPTPSSRGKGIFEAFVEPIPNYSGDLLAAMSLVSELKADGFRPTMQNLISTNEFQCTFKREAPFEIRETMGSKTLPEAICKAYLVVMLLYINPDAKKRALSEEME